MAGTVINLDTEVRKLRPAELYTLAQILSISESWKKLMAIVPKEGTDNVPKFNSEHFLLIEQAEQRQKRSAAEIFLEEWGTIGKKRPTLKMLLDLLIQAELFRAADYIAGDILKQDLPSRPNYGPAAAVDVCDEVVFNHIKEPDMLNDDMCYEESVERSGNESTLPAHSIPSPYPYKIIEISSQELPAFDQI